MIAPTLIADAVGLTSCALGLFACHGWWKAEARARLHWDAYVNPHRGSADRRGGGSPVRPVQRQWHPPMSAAG